MVHQMPDITLYIQKMTRNKEVHYVKPSTSQTEAEMHKTHLLHHNRGVEIETIKFTLHIPDKEDAK
jgi:hypothetical protein